MDNQEIFEQILNKKFKRSVFTGYDPVDVDKFFDYIVEYLKKREIDVESFRTTAENLLKENNDLKQENLALKTNVEKLKKVIKQYEDDGYGNIAPTRRKLQEKGAK